MDPHSRARTSPLSLATKNHFIWRPYLAYGQPFAAHTQCTSVKKYCHQARQPAGIKRILARVSMTLFDRTSRCLGRMPLLWFVFCCAVTSPVKLLPFGRRNAEYKKVKIDVYQVTFCEGLRALLLYWQVILGIQSLNECKCRFFSQMALLFWKEAFNIDLTLIGINHL